MTWYSSEIMLKPTPEALQYFSEIELLKGYVFLIPDGIKEVIKVYNEHGNIVDEEKTLDLSDDGLLIITPISEEGAHCSRWFEDYVSWHKITENIDLDAQTCPIDYATLFKQHPDSSDESLPPEDFLKYLHYLAAKLKTNIVYYSVFIWGGVLEFEYAFHFGEQEAGYIIMASENNSKVACVMNSVKLEVLQCDILQTSINYLGGRMKDGYCTLHTRSFEWSDYCYLPNPQKQS